MDRWVEHDVEVYATENCVTDEKTNAIPELTLMEELDFEPIICELKKAIDCLVTGKAPRSDNIPQIIKCGKAALLQLLYDLLCL